MLCSFPPDPPEIPQGAESGASMTLIDNGRGGVHYPELPQRLMKLLEARGLTTYDLAALIREAGTSICERTIRDILKGRRPFVREYTLNAIAEALGVSREELCGPIGILDDKQDDASACHEEGVEQEGLGEAGLPLGELAGSSVVEDAAMDHGELSEPAPTPSEQSFGDILPKPGKDGPFDPCQTSDEPDRPDLFAPNEQETSSDPKPMQVPSRPESLEPKTPVGQGNPHTPTHIRWMALLPILLTLALLIWALTALVKTSAGDVVVSRGNGGLVAYDARNKPVWRFNAKATIHFSDESPWHDDTWLVGLRGDASDGGRALLLDMRTGDRIWEIAPRQDRMRAVYGDTLLTSGAGFVALRHEAVDIDGDHEPELALIFNHDRFCPTCVILVERDGTRIGQYDHKGHFYDLLTEDIDGDGKEELLVAGTNNEPCYQGATVILLDDVCHAGVAQDSLAGGDPAVPDSARVRLVLPQFGEPYMTLLERRRIEAADLMVVPQESGLPRIAVNVGTEYKDYKVGVIVTLDAALDPVSVTPSDAIVAIAATWPDSVRARNGFPNQEWLERVWLPRAVRFEAGHWRGPATVPGAPLDSTGAAGSTAAACPASAASPLAAAQASPVPHR